MQSRAGGSSKPDAAPTADPDGDGLNNLGEYAHGTNPNLANASPILAELATIGPDRFLRVTIPKNPVATDITNTVEASPELQPATWSPTGLVIETNTTTLLRVRDGVPADSAPHRFLRVRVSLNKWQDSAHRGASLEGTTANAAGTIGWFQVQAAAIRHNWFH